MNNTELLGQVLGGGGGGGGGILGGRGQQILGD